MPACSFNLTAMRVSAALASLLAANAVKGADLCSLEMRVELDSSITNVLLPAEDPEKFNDELGRAVINSVVDSGQWSELCWRLVRDKQAYGVVHLTLAKPDSDWYLSVKYIGLKGTIRIGSFRVMDAAELAARRPSRAALRAKLGEWFLNFVVSNETHLTTLTRHVKELPVGMGVISTAGPKPEFTLLLPESFGRRFDTSQFVFVCRRSGEPDPPTWRLKAFECAPAVGGPPPAVVIRLTPAMGPDPKVAIATPCESIQAFLVDFVRTAVPAPGSSSVQPFSE